MINKLSVDSARGLIIVHCNNIPSPNEEAVPYQQKNNISNFAATVEVLLSLLLNSSATPCSSYGPYAYVQSASLSHVSNFALNSQKSP